MIWSLYLLTSVFVIYFDLVIDPTMEVSRLQVYVFQASPCIHSDTVACLVNRGKSKKKERRVFKNNVAFHWTQHEAQR